MPTATDSRRADSHAHPVESDAEASREEGYVAGKQRGAAAAPPTASTSTATGMSTFLEGETAPRARAKHPRAQETTTPASEPRYAAAMRTTTVIAQDGTPFLVYEPHRERPMWNYVLPLALLALGSFYAFQNPDLFGSSKQPSAQERPGGKQDLRYFDMLQNARVAPRFTTLENIGSDEGWIMQMDVPGFARNELNIFSVGPALTVRGTHTCPTGRNGRQEPICIERHVFEEIRFPDGADMETAQAKLDHGVLKVTVKPLMGYKPHGRVIQIMDAISEKVLDFGEAVKDKIGLNTAASRPVDQAQSAQRHNDAWDLDDMQPEEYIRQVVGQYVDSLRQSLQVPIEKAEHFKKLVRARTDDLVVQFRKRILTVQQLRDRVRRAAEEVWEELKQEAAHLDEKVRHKASEAYESTKDAAKQGVLESRDEAADLASKLGKAAESVGHKVKTTVQEKVGAAKEKAHEIVDDVLYNAEYAGHRAEEAGTYAAHRAAEQLGRAQDTIRESAHHAGNRASETVEKLHDRAKESAHYMRDRASEGAERAQDRAREESTYVRHVAEEAAQKAEHRVREAARHPNAAGRHVTYGAKAAPKGVFELIKEKLGWDSGS